MISSKRTISLVLFFVFACLYIHNLSRSVYGGDVGDLVTAASVWGIPHPPGYPLFTLLAGILIHSFSFTHQSPAFIAGLLSAISAALAIVLFFLISRKLTNNSLASLIGALTLGFSYLFWFYAEIAEVFALNNLFVLLMVYLALSYRESKKKNYLYLLAVTAGLSLANHQTILLIFPSLLLIASNVFSAVKKDKLLIVRLFLVFLLGFIPYIYTIIASLFHPIIDWAKIDSIQSFFDLVLRKKYGTFTLGDFAIRTAESRFSIFKSYIQIVFVQVTLPVILLSLVGMLSLFRKDRLLTGALVGAILISGPFFILFAGFAISNNFLLGVYERFLSMSTIFIILFFPIGIIALVNVLMRFFSKREFAVLFIGVFLLIPIKLFIFNMPKTDLSNVYLGDDLGRNYLAPLPKNSILFLSSDSGLFDSWYIRYALKERSDVTLLNGFSPSDAYSTILKISGEVEGKKNQFTFENFISLLKRSDNTRPIYSDTRYDLKDKKYSWVPYGLVFELQSPDDASMSAKQYKDTMEALWSRYVLPVEDRPANGNLTLSGLTLEYSKAMTTHSQKLLEYGYNDDAERFLKRALIIEPNSYFAYASLGSYYFLQKKDCEAAIPYLEKAVELFPITKQYYYYLYAAYLNCNNKEKVYSIQVLYGKNFGEGLVQSLEKAASESAKIK